MEKGFLYKAQLYFKLFIRTKYFIIPMSIFVLLNIPNVYKYISLEFFAPKIEYTRIQQPTESLILNFTEDSYDRYSELDETYLPKSYRDIDTYSELQIIIQDGISGIYKLNFTDNSSVIVSLAKNNLVIDDSKALQYKNTKGNTIKFIYNLEDIYMEVR